MIQRRSLIGLMLTCCAALEPGPGAALQPTDARDPAVAGRIGRRCLGPHLEHQ